MVGVSTTTWSDARSAFDFSVVPNRARRVPARSPAAPSQRRRERSCRTHSPDVALEHLAEPVEGEALGWKLNLAGRPEGGRNHDRHGHQQQQQHDDHRHPAHDAGVSVERRRAGHTSGADSGRSCQHTCSSDADRQTVGNERHREQRDPSSARCPPVVQIDLLLDVHGNRQIARTTQNGRRQEEAERDHEHEHCAARDSSADLREEICKNA